MRTPGREVIHRDLGNHAARLIQLERQVAEVKADVKQILAEINKAKGGWRTMFAIAGLAGTCGAAAKSLADKLVG